MSISLTIRWYDSDWRRPKTENKGRGAHKSEKVLRPPISVARLDEYSYGEGPGNENDKALDAVDDVLNLLETLGWELHCCSWSQAKLRRGATTLEGLVLCGGGQSNRYSTRNWGSCKMEALQRRVGRT